MSSLNRVAEIALGVFVGNLGFVLVLWGVFALLSRFMNWD